MSDLSHLRQIGKQLDDVANFLDDVKDGKDATITIARLQKVKHELDSLIIEYKNDGERLPYLIDMRNGLIRVLDEATTELRRILDSKRDFDQAVAKARRLLIREHNAEVHQAPIPNLCVRCNKRPKHFGDYCKRCANELGERPTGKVT